MLFIKIKAMIWIIILACVFLLVAACTPSVEPGATYTNRLSSEAYPAPNIAQEINAEIQELENSLQQDNLSQGEYNFAEDRLAELYILATKVFAPTPDVEEVEKAFEMEQTRIAGQIVAPTPTAELGILPDTSIYYEINLPRQVFVQNIWQGYIGEHLTRVYAGRLLPDNRVGNFETTHHGAIYVITLLPNGEFERSLHTTKDEIGALSIVSVDRAGRVTLIAQGFQNEVSKEIFFDIPTLQFASSLEEMIPLPTVTPSLN